MTSTRDTPLVVDLDGTLTLTDTLFESFIAAVKKSPINLIKLPASLLGGKAAFKAVIAREAQPDVEHLPYNEHLLEFLHEEKRRGRRIILATAAQESIAASVAKHLALFDLVLASNEQTNLKGRAKLKSIQENVGEAFSYAGDSKYDLPIWRAAQSAILVSVAPDIAAAVRRDVPIEREFPKEEVGLSTWLRALRVHQWMKNLLLFVPVLTAFSFFDAKLITQGALAFLAFSLAASATYIVNDLWDLGNDRRHPRKRSRPFAAGQISIAHGLIASASALGLGLLIAHAVSTGFFALLLLYIAATSAYSWVLKEYVLIDVLTLSLLYTLRILAGSVAIGVVVSPWLLAFSVFIFLSLALVKRCAELVSLELSGKRAAHGRDYRVTDLVALWPLGIAAGVSAVVIFGLFINIPETQQRYASPNLLWIAAVSLTYWMGRIWIKTSRGEMHDDPIIFAIKDRGSLVTVLSVIAIILTARFADLNTLF
jgi:4-hydroxybenzoate polyprenyltransferase/phosphoserine phosphatase